MLVSILLIITINTITNKILIASNNMKIITIINTTDGNNILNVYFLINSNKLATVFITMRIMTLV